MKWIYSLALTTRRLQMPSERESGSGVQTHLLQRSACKLLASSLSTATADKQAVTQRYGAESGLDSEEPPPPPLTPGSLVEPPMLAPPSCAMLLPARDPGRRLKDCSCSLSLATILSLDSSATRWSRVRFDSACGIICEDQNSMHIRRAAVRCPCENT